MHILLVEDDQATADYTEQGLIAAGHTVDVAARGDDGFALARRGRYQVLVVDRLLPALDGLSLIEKLRARHNKTPVLILSALDEITDRVEGLRAGGDDYLTKPFAFAELLARLEALARRASAAARPTKLGLGDLQMDLLTHEVKRGDRVIELQPREFRLLEYLLRHSGQVVTRAMLLENVWNYHFDPPTNVIDVHISRLRKKIDKDFNAEMLHTVRGAGYILRATEA